MRDLGASASPWEGLHPVHSWFSHGASVSPKQSKQDRRDSRVSAAVWKGLRPCVHLDLPRGVHIPEMAQAKPQAPGCIRRCVGVAKWCAYVDLPRGAPIPQEARAAPEGLRCIHRCVGVARFCAYPVLTRSVPIPQVAQEWP